MVEAGLNTKELTSVMKMIAVTDDAAEVVVNKKGQSEPDPSLRDNEIMPIPLGFFQLSEEEKNSELVRLAESHLLKEIKPYVSDAWIDHSKTKIGFEIPFMRQFFNYIEPRPVLEIKSELDQLEATIQTLMRDLK